MKAEALAKDQPLGQWLEEYKSRTQLSQAKTYSYTCLKSHDLVVKTRIGFSFLAKSLCSSSINFWLVFHFVQVV